MENRTFKQRCIYVAITVIAVFIVLAVLWHIVEIWNVCAFGLGKILKYIAPLIYGFIIAYILYIPLSKMEEQLNKIKKISNGSQHALRIFTVIVTFLAASIFVVAVIASIYLMVGGQISKNTNIEQIYNSVVEYISKINIGADLQSDNSLITKYVKAVTDWLESFVNRNLNNVGGMIGEISSKVLTIVVSIIISIYFMLDYEKLTDNMNTIYNHKIGRTKIGAVIYKTVNIFSSTFKQFLKGQLTEAFFVAVLSVIALKIAGVDYYGIIGIIAGICNLIPYVGPWIGAAVAVIVSLLGGNYMTAVWAIVAMILVQQLDNHILAPKVVGDSVGLHPVITMVVLLIGADVGGLAGMLLAVPVAATVKNVVAYYQDINFKNKYQSDSGEEFINFEPNVESGQTADFENQTGSGNFENEDTKNAADGSSENAGGSAEDTDDNK